MAQALDAAWARSLEAAEASGRQRRLQAEQRVADSWLAAPPALALSQREGQGAAADGVRETEVGVALPLWRLGQRQRNQESAQAESQWQAAAQQAARLRLAALLRDQVGRLRLAEADVWQATQQRRLFETLSDDVERRVRAGDLAPADAMAAKADLLASQTLERDASQAVDTQRSAWRLLTGWAATPEPDALLDLPSEDTALAQHPEAQLAEAAVQRARSRVAQAHAQRGLPPELGIGMRQERPGSGQARQNTVALSLRVPFGTDTHSQPAIAAALAEQDLALVTQERIRRQLTADLELARRQLDRSEAQVAAGQEQATLLRERTNLLNHAFQAGESPLPELLRAMGASAQAEIASARQQAALAQARARLQQALGVMP